MHHETNTFVYDVRPKYAWMVASIFFLTYVANISTQYLINYLANVSTDNLSPDEARFENLRSDTGITEYEYGILTGIGFSLLFVVSTLVAGRAGDKYDRRLLLSIGVALCGVSQVALGFCHQFWSVLLCQVVSGIGQGFCSPSVVSLLSDYFPARKRATANAIYALGCYVGSGFASLSILIAQSLGWRGACYVIGGCAVVVAALVAGLVQEPTRVMVDTTTAAAIERKQIEKQQQAALALARDDLPFETPALHPQRSSKTKYRRAVQTGSEPLSSTDSPQVPHATSSRAHQSIGALPGRAHLHALNLPPPPDLTSVDPASPRSPTGTFSDVPSTSSTSSTRNDSNGNTHDFTGLTPYQQQGDGLSTAIPSSSSSNNNSSPSLSERRTASQSLRLTLPAVSNHYRHSYSAVESVSPTTPGRHVSVSSLDDSGMRSPGGAGLLSPSGADVASPRASAAGLRDVDLLHGHEPSQSSTNADDSGRISLLMGKPGTSIGAACRLIFRPVILRLLFLAASVRFIGGYAIGSFMPAFYSDHYPEYKSRYSVVNAVVVSVGGSISTFAGGWVSDWWAKRNGRARSLIPAIGALLAIPCMVGALWVDSFYLSMLCFFFEYVCAECWFGPAFALLQSESTPSVRGLSISAYVFCTTITGSLCPVVLSAINADNKWRLLYSVVASYAVAAVLFLWLSTQFQERVRGNSQSHADSASKSLFDHGDVADDDEDDEVDLDHG